MGNVSGNINTLGKLYRSAMPYSDFDPNGRLLSKYYIKTHRKMSL